MLWSRPHPSRAPPGPLGKRPLRPGSPAPVPRTKDPRGLQRPQVGQRHPLVQETGNGQQHPGFSACPPADADDVPNGLVRRRRHADDNLMHRKGRCAIASSSCSCYVSKILSLHANPYKYRDTKPNDQMQPPRASVTKWFFTSLLDTQFFTQTDHADKQPFPQYQLPYFSRTSSDTRYTFRVYLPKHLLRVKKATRPKPLKCY